MTYKLLIVDDSKLARMAVVKALNSCYPDWQRVEAGNAADALRAMEADAPHVALVDFNMPNRDGLHLAADLRKLNPKCRSVSFPRTISRKSSIAPLPWERHSCRSRSTTKRCASS